MYWLPLVRWISDGLVSHVLLYRLAAKLACEAGTESAKIAPIRTKILIFTDLGLGCFALWIPSIPEREWAENCNLGGKAFSHPSGYKWGVIITLTLMDSLLRKGLDATWNIRTETDNMGNIVELSLKSSSFRRFWGPDSFLGQFLSQISFSPSLKLSSQKAWIFCGKCPQFPRTF